MALSEIRAFGLREIKLTDQSGLNPVALPIAMTMRFTERIQTEHFLAEGVEVGAASIVERLDWELEAGGISLSALAKLTGRTATAAGSTPNQTLTMNTLGGDRFPYIRVYGRSVGDSADDIHGKIWKAKVTALSGEFRQGQFLVTKCSGVAVKDFSLGLYQFIQHETAIAL